jgi:hypothetical protein
MHTLSTLTIRPDVRGEDLPLTKWLALVHLLTVHD